MCFTLLYIYQVKLRFVDFGLVEEVPRSSLCHLPKEFADIPFQVGIKFEKNTKYMQFYIKVYMTEYFYLLDVVKFSSKKTIPDHFYFPIV